MSLSRTSFLGAHAKRHSAHAPSAVAAATINPRAHLVNRQPVRPGLQERRQGPRAALAEISTASKRRNYATSMQDKNEKPFTLDAFYAEILKQPKTQKVDPPPVDPNNPPKPIGSLATPSSDTGYGSIGRIREPTPAEKARIIFGTRLASPVERRRELDRKSTLVAGVLVPPRPDEPDNCCMSGCVNCVWDLYREEIEAWAEKSAEAKQKLQERATRDHGPTAIPSTTTVDHTMTSMDDDGGSSETLWTAPAGEPSADYFGGIPVGIREFMKTEKRLKQQKLQTVAVDID